MTTVSSSSAAAPPISQPRSEKAGAHKQRLLDRISAQQQAGSLSATDASALTSAVQDIDQAMSGASGTSGTGAGGTRLDPALARSRMDDLIGAEVTKGTLTSDQATTLKNLLSSHKGSDRDGDRGGDLGGDLGGMADLGGVGGAGGAPPGLPSPGAADATGSTPATSAAATDPASTATSASDLLAGFIKQLQDAQAQTQASGYGASGTAARRRAVRRRCSTSRSDRPVRARSGRSCRIAVRDAETGAARARGPAAPPRGLAATACRSETVPPGPGHRASSRNPRRIRVLASIAAAPSPAPFSAAATAAEAWTCA